MNREYAVSVGAGTMRGAVRSDAEFPHQWTDGGVAVETRFTGAHILHLSVAACVLNDLYREAAALEVRIDGVRVQASGGFDTATWRSTGIVYCVEIDSPASDEDIAQLVSRVDEVAEIPRVLRTAATVARTHPAV